jgi:hypothetical protein
MFFNKKEKVSRPIERGLYAFTKHRRGIFLLFLNFKDDNIFEFMQLPDRYVLCLIENEFKEAVCSGLLDFVEQLPEDVFEVAVANKIIFEK